MPMCRSPHRTWLARREFTRTSDGTLDGSRSGLPSVQTRIRSLTKRIGHFDSGMVLTQTLLDDIAYVPLQFGGDLIGLAILFLVLAVVAMILGARGVAGLSMDIAKWLVIIFVVLAIITFFL